MRLVLRMIKFEHTIFALPFAFLGAFLAAGGIPQGRTIFWILAAMFGARSAAMAFNRLADRRWDALNPRTRQRELPQRLLQPAFVRAFVAGSSALFVLSAWMLNPLAFFLSPLALTIVFFYSYTKRFTSFSHLFLGLSLAMAPVGGWIAVAGEVSPAAWLLAASVLFWVAGFDLIYACQDADFDRGHGLHSIPSRYGVRAALRLSGLFHVLTAALLGATLYVQGLSVLSWIGLTLVSAILVYEHRLVRPDDLSRLNAAFFTVNGVVSIVLFLFIGVDLCLLA
ncbi:MAG TPA: UbiA-like polyprenyltransferase [Acidobacteriota bacterium]|nr:UbiA-like polyprenyltransferase [Acidobacteriota bacterium]